MKDRVRVTSFLIDVFVRRCEDVEAQSPASQLQPGGLAVVLDGLPDPRRRRGCRYWLGLLAGLCLIAVLAGARSLTAIDRFACNADLDLLNVLGLLEQMGRITVGTLGRLLSRLEVMPWTRRLAVLAEARPPTERGPVGLAVDGKTLRGNRTPEGTVHLLATTLHEGRLVSRGREQWDPRVWPAHQRTRPARCRGHR